MLRRERPAEIQETQTLELSGNPSLWDDLGVTYFLRSVAAHKWLLVLIPVFAIAISNVWFLLSRDTYSGEIQVVPASVGASSARSGNIGDILGSSGLASFLSSTSNDATFSVYVESWTAPWFAEDLIANTALSRRIFAGQWSAEAGEWREPPSSLRGILGTVKMALGGHIRPWTPPDAETMLGFLNRSITIRHNRNEVITTISLEGPDRDLIRDVLNYGHRSIEDHIRHVFQKRAEENIAYLLNKLPQVSVTEYRKSLVEELAQQEKIRMMAYANEEFAAQSLGVYVTTSPVRPQTRSVVAMSLVLSLVAYAALVVLAGRSGRSRRAAVAKVNLNAPNSVAN